MNLQEQFVQFYEQSGYTQPQLARAIGVSSASVNMYVNGKYEAHGGNLATIEKKVAAFFGARGGKEKRGEAGYPLCGHPHSGQGGGGDALGALGR